MGLPRFDRNPNIIYENDNYEVQTLWFDNTRYHIFNKETKQYEGATEALPSAISKADVLSELVSECKSEGKL